MNARIVLLRVLLASWCIPMSWIVMWPLFYLLSGAKVATNDIIDFDRRLWNGL